MAVGRKEINIEGPAVLSLGHYPMGYLGTVYLPI